MGRAGVVLGLDWPSGGPAEVPWRAAERGVLVAGGAAGEVGFRFVHAAIRRRKPVLVVDLAGDPGLAAALAAVCAEVGAPLHVFGTAGPGCYDPLRGGDPTRNAALVLGMVDWAAVTDSARRTGVRLPERPVRDTAAVPGDPGIPVLDEVIHLLSPDALRRGCARCRRITRAAGAGRTSPGVGEPDEAESGARRVPGRRAGRAACVAAGPVAAPGRRAR